jgi:hypothetical protein
MASAVENPDRDYRNRNIYNLLDSQAAVQVRNNYHMNSKLAWDCHQSLVKLGAVYTAVRSQRY